MKHQIPPDRDPELRRAFAMKADEQCALLDTMAGVPQKEPRDLLSRRMAAAEVAERLRRLLEGGQR